MNCARSAPKPGKRRKPFLDSHRNDKGVLSAEDDAAYTRMEQEITDLGKEIARLERQEALEAELNLPCQQAHSRVQAHERQAGGAQ